MAKTDFRMCFKMGCGNPVDRRVDEIDACGRHGGETRIVWSLYKIGEGWLSDNDTVIEWTFNVDEARWFASDADVKEWMDEAEIGCTPSNTHVVRLR